MYVWQWRPHSGQGSANRCAMHGSNTYPHDHTKCAAANLALNVWTAASWGDLHAVMHSVEARNVDPSKPDDHGFTPLHHAATSGHEDIVRFLLSRRAAVNAAACGASPLHRAAFSGFALRVFPLWR